MIRGQKKKTRQQFIDESKLVHGDNAFDYTFVDYINTDTKVILLCNKCNFMFDQIPHSHLGGSGCRGCWIINKTKTTEIFIKQAFLIHKNEYDYSEVKYLNSKEKVIIKHIACDEKFDQSPLHHLNGTGCPYCFGNMRGTTADFIKRSIEKYGDKYDYSLVKYINAITPVEIICRKHDVFWQEPYSHLAGHKCKKCVWEILPQAQPKTKEKILNQFNEIHEDRYDYSLMNYINGSTEIIIVCKNCSGLTKVKPRNHLTGTGCSHCNMDKFKMENEWLDLLKVPIKYRQTKLKINGRRFKLDALIPKTNTIYEFNGDYWHGNPLFYDQSKKHPTKPGTFGDAYQKTLERATILKSAGYNLIHIWESDWLAQKKEMAKNAEK